MGRKKMYFTAKEKKEAQRKWQMDYYYRNKDSILKKMKDKYRQKKLNSLVEFGTSFQSKVIASCLTDTMFLQTIMEVLEPEYFESDSNKWLVKEIHNYFIKYKTTPTLEAIKIAIDDVENDISLFIINQFVIGVITLLTKVQINLGVLHQCVAIILMLLIIQIKHSIVYRNVVE